MCWYLFGYIFSFLGKIPKNTIADPVRNYLPLKNPNSLPKCLYNFVSPQAIERIPVSYYMWPAFGAGTVL